MDVKAFLEASDYPILHDWRMGKSNEELYMALKLVKTSHFKNWYSSHPHGTMDQYLAYRDQQITAYYNSPEYQIQSLQEQLGELNVNIQELTQEVKEKDNKIEELNSSLSQAKTFAFTFGVISLCLLLFILRKRLVGLIKKLKK